jgi:hypothetical protein
MIAIIAAAKAPNRNGRLNVVSLGNVILSQNKRKRDFGDLGLRGIVSMFGVFGGREGE